MCTPEFYGRPAAANSLEDVHNSMAMFIPALRVNAPAKPAAAPAAPPVVVVPQAPAPAPIDNTPMQLGKPTLLGR